MDPEQPASTNPLLAPTPEDLAAVSVFPLIPALKKEITETIDTALSWEQLNASDIKFAIVRPLVHKYGRLRNMAIVYACLVVRSYFLAQADMNLAFTAVMQSRANLCELLAIKLVSKFSNYMDLVAVLATAWSPLAGASPAVVEEVKYVISKHELETAQTALEMAISTKAKAFLATPAVQNVINDIYSGHVVFSLHSTRSILVDNYKPRAIQLYDVRRAPFLNHYRLRVPRYEAILDFLNFAILLITFVLCLAEQDKAHLTLWELAFVVVAMSHVLEEYTVAAEHGWYIYIANMWNAFDFSFLVVFLAYFFLRIRGLHNGDLETSNLAFNILACGGCILFPRLVFFAVTNHVIILSLQAMTVQFVVFIGTVMICFSGLLFTLWVFARDATLIYHQEPWTVSSLAWYCIQIWLGNSFVIFGKADSFHPFFGPLLVTIFAVFSNTLLVTILISILSNTVAKIGANASQEYLYQFAISTIEGVKDEALFSYQPPFNIMAFLILKPASWFLTPRALHTTNVFLIKLTSLPQLIAITIYERHFQSDEKCHQTNKEASQSLFRSIPRHIKHMPLVDALVGTHSDIYDAIMDMEMDDEINIFAGFEDAGSDLVSSRMHSRENSLTGSISQATGAALDPLSGQPLSASSTSRRRTRTQTTSTTRANLRALNGTRPPHSRMQSAQVPGALVLDQKLGSEGYGSTTTGAPLFETEDVFPPRLNTRLSNGSLVNPLTRFLGRNSLASSDAEQTVIAASAETTASVRRVEALLAEVKSLPVNKLKEEMKEIQERQHRIESLLLMLTRGMRNDHINHDAF